MKLLAAAWNDVVRVPENRSAGRAVRQLARAVERGQSAVSPLVLHGPPGTGKTLLVGGLVRAVTGSPLGRTAQVVPANDLDPRTDGDADDWGGFRDCDLLVVEDVQHLPGHAADALGRLLDARTARRRPTVVTASVGPAVLDVSGRLASRLAAGLVVPLAAFSPASRAALLSYHADRLRLKLTPDAIDWLAEQPGGFRPLLGKLHTLKALARGPLTREDVAKLLADGDATPAGVAEVVAAVAAAFGVKPKELLGPSRLKTVLLARQTAIHLARETLGLSLPALGRAFGRDHSTALHAVRKVGEAMARDAAYAARVRDLRAALGGR